MECICNVGMNAEKKKAKKKKTNPKIKSSYSTEETVQNKMNGTDMGTFSTHLV